MAAARDGWSRATVFGLAAGFPALGVSLFMQAVSQGRFLAYLLAIPASHPTVGGRIFPGTPGELASAMPVAVVVAGAYLVARALAVEANARIIGSVVIVSACTAAGIGLGIPYPGGVMAPAQLGFAATLAALGAALGATVVVGVASARRRRFSWRWVYGVGVVATALVTAGLMRGHHGGFLNVHMPMHWVVAFAFGIAVARIRASYPGPLTWTWTAAALAGQLGLMSVAIHADPLLPTPADVAAGDRVVERIRANCHGPVFSPYAAWLPAQAGLASSAHLIAIWDINHETGPFRQQMSAFARAAREQYWDCVVEGGRQQMGFELGDGYRLAERFPVRWRELLPRTGWRVRPTELDVRADRP